MVSFWHFPLHRDSYTWHHLGLILVLFHFCVVFCRESLGLQFLFFGFCYVCVSCRFLGFFPLSLFLLLTYYFAKVEGGGGGRKGKLILTTDFFVLI